MIDRIRDPSECAEPKPKPSYPLTSPTSSSLLEMEMDNDGNEGVGAKRRNCNEMTELLGTKRVRIALTQEKDIKQYEANIHEALSDFVKLREHREKEFEKVFGLIFKGDHARTRRKKVFTFFEEAINKEQNYQVDEVYKISKDLLSLLDECREQLVNYVYPIWTLYCGID